MNYVVIGGKRIAYTLVGQPLEKGYLRISRKSKLFELARAKLGSQWEAGVWLHVAICAVAKGRPPGRIGNSPTNWTVGHRDGDNLNNAASNLRWCLRTENTSDGNRNRS